MNASEGSIITGTLDDAIRDILASDDETAREYLRSSFLSSAVLKLWQARQDARLTQKEVAESLGTKQSAIARMEADLGGSMSLHRYVDFCLACGRLPFDIELGLVEELRTYALADPEAPRTAAGYQAWAHAAGHSNGVAISSQPELDSVSMGGWQRPESHHGFLQYKSALFVTYAPTLAEAGQPWKMKSQAFSPVVSTLQNQAA